MVPLSYWVYFLYSYSISLVSDVLFFFFSSRRRHTRCSRDWSSDVCSSDLVFIGASRTISQWLQIGPVMESPGQYLEGSPLDRLVLTGLLAAGLMVLLARGRRTGTFVQANGPILAFFFYCAVSVFWSDYPDVAFKRWTKALGNLVMVLVVLTDPHPSAAVKRLLARSGFLLIPLSFLLVKYYPDLGRGYSPWI